MNSTEIKVAIKDVVTSYATGNTDRAEQGLHEVLQAKMQGLLEASAEGKGPTNGMSPKDDFLDAGALAVHHSPAEVAAIMKAHRHEHDDDYFITIQLRKEDHGYTMAQLQEKYKKNKSMGNGVTIVSLGEDGEGSDKSWDLRIVGTKKSLYKIIDDVFTEKSFDDPAEIKAGIEKLD